jgi:type IV fimbrial biogenesis protein FimT
MLEQMNTARTRLMAAKVRAFTLVELLVVIALFALIATLAAPSFDRFLAKKRVEGVAAELVTDLQYARSEAAQRNEVVRVTFGDRCYVIHAGGSASCSAGAASVISGGGVELKTVDLNEHQSTSISPSSGLVYVEFDPQRGTANTAAAVDIESASSGIRLRTIVTATGQVRTCSPDASVSGYTACG